MFDPDVIEPLIFMQDANVRLIRELREEIDRLKSMLLSFEMVCEPSESLRPQWVYPLSAVSPRMKAISVLEDFVAEI